MISRLIAWVLSALLVVTGGTLAAARGADTTGQALVICSGYGVVTVVLDRYGEPVGTVHPCPDCLPALAGVLPVALPAVARPASRAEPLRLAVLPAPRVAPMPAPPARGPPRA